MPVAEILVTASGAMGAAIFGYLGVRFSARVQSKQADTERELGLIDRWQTFATEADKRATEMEARLTARISTQEAAIRELRNRIGHVEMKEKILIQYALSLREHIDKQLPPPPPAWPVFPTYTNHDQP